MYATVKQQRGKSRHAVRPSGQKRNNRTASQRQEPPRERWTVNARSLAVRHCRTLTGLQCRSLIRDVLKNVQAGIQRISFVECYDAQMQHRNEILYRLAVPLPDGFLNRGTLD